MSTLYIVATPIGNLSDITYRAVETLSTVSIVYAEDTRVSKRLLDHYEVSTSLRTFNEHSDKHIYSDIVEALTKGDVALVSDAGTPGIADPGARIVAYVREQSPETLIVPIPGASAVSTILSVSGVNSDSYTFLGYVPHKKGRKTFFEQLPTYSARPVVFYESPHRIEKTLESLNELPLETTKLVIGRELTKKFEEIFSGTASEAKEYFKNEHLKGEFVIVIE